MFSRTNWGQQPWLLLHQYDLTTERLQCESEGKDLSEVADELEALGALELQASEEAQRRAEALLDRTLMLPIKADFPYQEPSDLAGIQAARPAAPALPGLPDAAAIRDKTLGGWQGRAAGCLLGKPVEGRRRPQIEKYLKAQERWPLDRYFSNQAPEEVVKDCGFNLNNPGVYEETITCMPEDDDTNYTATGLAIVKQYGHDFTPEHVAGFWLSNIPIFHVCTAERIAYRNLVDGYAPPASAMLRNPFREWIGAQIRADFFGYVNPGDPARAAEYAWRDAAISHIKNGIYGEMWVAAMLAAAYVTDDVEAVIRAGLAQVPANCRLTAGIEHIHVLHKQGKSYTEALDDLHARWDETRQHDWCHTISNAEIVAIALLWGGMDFEKTVCYAVMPGFDTDCNGATAGSVIGVILGAARLPSRWIAPMNDTLLTGVAGYHKVSLTQMAEETVELMRVGQTA